MMTLNPRCNTSERPAARRRSSSHLVLGSLVSLLTLLASLKASAQWSIGLNGGYARNILTTSQEYADEQRYEPHNGFTIGIPVQYDFRPWFGLRAELSFVQKGQSSYRTGYYEGIYTDTRNNYLQLPVIAHFSFGGERLRGFLHLGGYVGYWLSSHRQGVTAVLMGSNPETGDLPYPFDEKVPFDSRRDNRFEAGLAGGIGLYYRITPRIRIEAEGRCYYALTDMQKNYMKFLIPRYNTTFTTQIGCVITLGKLNK